MCVCTDAMLVYSSVCPIFFGKRNSNLILNLLGINFFHLQFFLFTNFILLFFSLVFGTFTFRYSLYGLQLTFIYFLFQYLSLVLIKIPFNYKINLNEQESDEVDPRLSSIRDTSFSWESIDSQAGSRQSLLDNKGRCRLLNVSQTKLGAIQVSRRYDNFPQI